MATRCVLALAFAFMAVVALASTDQSPASAPAGSNSESIPPESTSAGSTTPGSSVTTPFAAMAPGTDLVDNIAPSESGEDVPVDDAAANVAPAGTPIVENTAPEDSGDSRSAAPPATNAASSITAKVSCAAAAIIAGFFVF